MYLAQNSIFIAISMMLYAFNISMATDEKGDSIVPEVEYEGFMRCFPPY